MHERTLHICTLEGVTHYISEQMQDKQSHNKNIEWRCIIQENDRSWLEQQVQVGEG